MGRRPGPWQIQIKTSKRAISLAQVGILVKLLEAITVTIMQPQPVEFTIQRIPFRLARDGQRWSAPRKEKVAAAMTAGLTLHSDAIGILRCCFSASFVLGSVIDSIPLSRVAAILSASMPAGSWNDRWNDP